MKGCVRLKAEQSPETDITSRAEKSMSFAVTSERLFDGVFYEPEALNYPLGRYLWERYSFLPWTEIENHNNIPQMRAASNREFAHLKRHLIVGVRKTHRYTENGKVSDFLVPYTSSGCRAMCLYCYLVCNYNKCAYLRVFVNREEMMDKMVQKANAEPGRHVFEIGSNSDLVLENAVTGNLPWTVEEFARRAKGKLTFPTKFGDVEPLLNLDHRRKIIFRVSVNPEELIRKVELGTSPLSRRINAVNAMCGAGYPVGVLLAPVILTTGWEILYEQLLDTLSKTLDPAVKRGGFLEVIFMTYSFLHNAINSEAFPNTLALYRPDQMVGRGRGKYRYREGIRQKAEELLRNLIGKYLPGMPVLYIS